MRVIKNDLMRLSCLDLTHGVVGVCTQCNSDVQRLSISSEWSVSDVCDGGERGATREGAEWRATAARQPQTVCAVCPPDL